MSALYEIVQRESQNGNDKKFSSIHHSRDDEVDIKMYIVVNTTPKLSRGKICAQVGHAVQGVVNIIRRNKKRWSVYNQNGSTKIVLKAGEEMMKNIIEETTEKQKVFVVDAGQTQCPPNTVTAIGFLPMYPHEVPKIIKWLSLL